MLESGYIRLYRSFLTWEWYTDGITKDVFLHLILTANWEPKKWRGITIERGQRVFSYAKLSKELHISVQQVRTAISHLKSTGEITCLGKSEYSIVTVKNYELYQQATSDSTSDQQAINKRPTSDQQQLKKDKESKNDNKAIKKERVVFIPPTLDEVTAYCAERDNGINPQAFIDFYESKGWMIGPNHMKDWKAAVRTWESHERRPQGGQRTGNNQQPTGEDAGWNLDGITVL